MHVWWALIRIPVNYIGYYSILYQNGGSRVHCLQYSWMPVRYRFNQFSVIHQRSLVLDVIRSQPCLYLVSQSLKQHIKTRNMTHTPGTHNSLRHTLDLLATFWFLSWDLPHTFLSGWHWMRCAPTVRHTRLGEGACIRKQKSNPRPKGVERTKHNQTFFQISSNVSTPSATFLRHLSISPGVLEGEETVQSVEWVAQKCTTSRRMRTARDPTL